MTEEANAVLRLLEDTERVLRLLRRRDRDRRAEWRATWAPVTERLYGLDCERIAAKRARQIGGHLAA